MEQAPPPVRDPERDTIAAIATPPGTGALAIVRVSGPGAVAVADAVFRGRAALRAAASHTAHYGAIVRPPDDRSGAGAGEVIDDVVATVFRAPASYTGDDTVEITCHGSNLVAATIVGALLNKGARNADPGEFTRRAFLNGKLDLTQAEAVAEVIRSATAASLRGARNRLNGALGARVSALRQQLLDCAVHVELALDFADEDIELAPAELVASEVREVRAAIAAMLATFRTGRMLRDGIHVVLAGPPNVGKSSLLNRLAREARALVTDVPGTTRDVIREDLDIHGVPVRLYDTAGLRATEEIVERLGVERSIATVADADLVLFVCAANEPFPHAALRQVRAATAPTGAQVAVIANKSDLRIAVSKIAVTYRIAVICKIAVTYRIAVIAATVRRPPMPAPRNGAIWPSRRAPEHDSTTCAACCWSVRWEPAAIPSARRWWPAPAIATTCSAPRQPWRAPSRPRRRRSVASWSPPTCATRSLTWKRSSASWPATTCSIGSSPSSASASSAATRPERGPAGT